MKKDNTDIQIERVYKEIKKVEPDITSLLKKLYTWPRHLLKDDIVQPLTES